MEKYLFGLDWDPFDGIPGIFVTDHHISGYRYFSNYQNAKAKKPAIFIKLKAGGMDEISGEWDWHHVVEGNHLEPLFSKMDYDRFYQMQWPTVLMHSAEEHKILNSLLRSKGTTSGLNKTSSLPLKGIERTAYLKTLFNRYQDVYIGDRILQKVASNVIKSLT